MRLNSKKGCQKALRHSPCPASPRSAFSSPNLPGLTSSTSSHSVEAEVPEDTQRPRVGALPSRRGPPSKVRAHPSSTEADFLFLHLSIEDGEGFTLHWPCKGNRRLRSHLLRAEILLEVGENLFVIFFTIRTYYVVILKENGKVRGRAS